MALKLHLKRFTGLKERSSWQARVVFRGVPYRTRTCALCSGQTDASFDEVFEWTLGSAIDGQEQLEIFLVHKNRYNISPVHRSAVGSYRLRLEELVAQRHLVICNGALSDEAGRSMTVGVTLELHYVTPADSSLYQVEQSISELERQYAAVMEQSTAAQPLTLASDTDTDGSGGDRAALLQGRRSRSMGSAVRNIASMIRIKPKRTRRSSSASDDETDGYNHHVNAKLRRPSSTSRNGADGAGCVDDHAARYGSTQSILRHLSDDALDALAAGDHPGLTDDRLDAARSITSPVLVKRVSGAESRADALKAQDFQICVTVIEARHLAGLNMDPVVCVQVADQRKYTSVKESTNCPYYNEYFVFDFHCAEAVLFDKMMILTALHSRNLIRSGKVIGSFKLDVATIFRQPDHQFWHKWAVLTDPDDMSGGPKGYVKCDIAVVGKGEAAKTATSSQRGGNPGGGNADQDDDIEGNLLLPEGMPSERQHARYVISIHSADGLPRANAGNIVASVKKVLTADSQRRQLLIDPYVQVSFAGLTARTSTKRGCCSPAWNEQIVFTELFPPLCQRIRLQLRDSGPVSDSVIATHFIDISKISNDGDRGFLPTFGPCYVFLYGSTRSGDTALFRRSGQRVPLNDGLAEGVMYRGRLLVSVRTQVLPEMAVMQLPPSVHVEAAPAVVAEDHPVKNEEFLLSAVIMEAHMIDHRFQDKVVEFELSIGNAGNTLDGECLCGMPATRSGSIAASDSSASVSSMSGGAPGAAAATAVTSAAKGQMCWCSTTPPTRAVPSSDATPRLGDSPLLHLAYGCVKPVLWVRSSWPDHRRRLYLSNMLHRIQERLEFGISDILEMVRRERTDVDRRLKGVLEQLGADCVAYLQHHKQEKSARTGGSVKYGLKKSRLDRERERHCQREVDHIGTMARAMKPLVNKHSFKEKLRATQGFLRKIRDICEDAQHSLPDVFIWMLVAGKRLAYYRVPARKLIYSSVDEQRGPLCRKRQTILLKPSGVGKRSLSSSSWLSEATLEGYIWLGLWEEREHSLDGVPEGHSKVTIPTDKLHYTERGKYLLRAHMYQARSLIASDSSGLSDPFAQVHYCGGHSACTQVIEQTLSPSWDEMLQLQRIDLVGSGQALFDDPPLVVVNVFDQDSVGKCEFLGRALVRPHVKIGSLLAEKTERSQAAAAAPQLEWHNLYRGPHEMAGQLLAVFELIECNSITGDSTGRVECVEPIWRREQGPVLPIPRSIRPTLSRYKIEMLFWGLRDLRRINLLKVDRPRVDIECGGHTVQSTVITNYSKNPNFSMPIKTIDVDLPDQEIYCPPVTIRVVDCRSFGRFVLVGTHVVSSIHRFIQQTAREAQDSRRRRLTAQGPVRSAQTETLIDVEAHGESPAAAAAAAANVVVIYLNRAGKVCEPANGHVAGEKNSGRQKINFKKPQSKKRKSERGCSIPRSDDLSEDSKDWWSRYFASIQSQMKASDRISADEGFHSERLRMLCDQYSIIKVYTSDLESVPDYNGFGEWMESFQLLRGKRTGDDGDDERRSVGTFKGSLRVHRYPLPADWEPATVASNEPTRVLVRVYVVRATDLHPADLNGKADPYLVLRLGANRTSDKDNYVSKQLNPVFGKCFQFEATFPQDSLLHVQVFDWDLLGRDDLIGETKIDLENRFYSKHRATCGLPLKYDTEAGPNQWRDPLKPSQILGKLCKDHKLDGPHCLPPGNRIRVGCTTFVFKNSEQDDFEGVRHHPQSSKVRAGAPPSQPPAYIGCI